MEKNIVTIRKNNRGEIIDKTADYIGVDAFAKYIEELYRECLDDFDDKEEIEEYINDCFGDNHIHTLAVEFAIKQNEDMKEYLHMDNHRMDGNFANVADDYTKYRTGTYWPTDYDGDDYDDLFPDMVKRLDAAEDSDRANDDREYLSSWYFFAFGTYNIKYNFSSELSEVESMLEEAREESAETA